MYRLEEAVGSQIRKYRKQLKMTVVEIAKKANMSAGMLSKIERGVTAPSLSTMQNLANALNVPITSFFKMYEQQRNCSYVKAGQGLAIERRGTRTGHHYELLGHNVQDELNIEPYLITLNDKSEAYPLFEHPGLEFIYMLEGIMEYRHWNDAYRLEAGDSLFFDADVPHGPIELIELPIRMIAVLCQANTGA